jgi:two-component sensor histidine kinase
MDFENALKFYKSAMDLSYKIDDLYGVVLASNNYSSLLLELGQLDSAKKYLDISSDICVVLNDSVLFAEVEYNYGDYYLAMHKYSEAEKALKLSFRISSAQQIIELQLKSTDKLSEFYSEIDRYKLAFKYLTIYDSIYNKINADDVKKHFSMVDEQYKEETRKKEATLKELEFEAISAKLKYNQILSIISFSGLLIIIIFIIVFFIKYKQEYEVKSKLEYVNKELSRINKEYQQTLISKKEKDILLKEIHHRVKNNLQIINSLLNAQAIKAPKNTGGIFVDLQTRITAISLLHDQLYIAKDFSKIEVDDYFKQLINHLKTAYAIANTVKFDIKINVDFLELDMLHPLGLLVNEIISNSLKYAFDKTTRKNTIYLYFDQKGDDFTLKIGDFGIGFNEAEAKLKQNSIGLELIYNLAEQLDGNIKMTDKVGTHYRLNFSQ